MASIVLRKDGRAEIRESYTTPRGPRSRTLAVFRELTERDLDKAEGRASRPFSRARILARARKLGVPRFGDSASRAARALLAELQMGRPLAPTLVSALQDALDSRPARELPESIDALLPWLAATDEERGEALRECMHPARGLSAGGLSKATPRDEKVALLARGLEAADVPHAFGGDLALGYYALPEAVVAPELLVFEPAARMGQALTALAKLGLGAERERELAQLRESGSTRLAWGRIAVEVYCAWDAWHEDCRRRIRRVPFGEDAIWILSAEDLTVTATLAGLVGQDARLPPVELERLLFGRVGSLDLAYVRDWLDRILDPADPRRLGFEEVAKRLLGDHYLFYGTTLTCRIESDGPVIRQVLVLAGAVELPDPSSQAFDRLARGVPAGGALVKKAEVRDSTASLSGLAAGTYTVAATGYELANPRRRVMHARRLELAAGVEAAEVDFRF